MCCFFIIWFWFYLIACLTKTLLNLESMLSPCQPELVDHFDPYNVFLTIATNIPVQLMTFFVVQGHIYTSKTYLGVHSGSLRAPNKLESPLVKNNIFLSLSLSELHTVHPTIHLRPTDMDGKSLHLRV